MANRSYLYSLGNRPRSYADRPETISGLSEWAYAVPFSYRVLMSGDPALCASLVSDGFEDDPPDRPTRLHAISGEFDAGHARLRKLLAAVRAVTGSTALSVALDETERFLAEHRDRFLLLETIELDSMTEESGDGLRASVEREIDLCGRVGAAVDALPDDVTEAGAALAKAAASEPESPFHGLVLDDDFDNVRGDRTTNPLGVSWWTDVLYFELWNKAEFEANS
ncbi:hypothetical protein [Actinophytocola oryzae]|uniref:DUF7822 domain-containing protein n=1 Tax=Actinophytocola oryzae TaxID=502181 RepID=A0A4R7W4W4_9PSEU|nr:hypothetical protein [Actinophytocola oryzae]TDV57763.1 hypothetical protein CLV71_101636 [Actinophytocola oryzae]